MLDGPIPGYADAAGAIVIGGSAIVAGGMVIYDGITYIGNQISQAKAKKKTGNCQPDEKKEKAKGEAEAGKKPTSQNQLQNQVEKGQAPKEVDRVDKPHVDGQQPHVHFKDGTSLNQDGTIHDAHRGTPNITNKVKDWLINNGWKVND